MTMSDTELDEIERRLRHAHAWDDKSQRQAADAIHDLRTLAASPRAEPTWRCRYCGYTRAGKERWACLHRSDRSNSEAICEPENHAPPAPVPDGPKCDMGGICPTPQQCEIEGKCVDFPTEIESAPVPDLVAEIDDHFHVSLDAWGDDPRAVLLSRARDRIVQIEQERAAIKAEGGEDKHG
jgi:hypothetical protein